MDLLFDGNGNKIGPCECGQIDREVFAERLEIDVNTVQQGTFAIKNKMLVSSKNGQWFTYASASGPINMARFVETSALTGNTVFYREDGGLVAFLNEDDARNSGMNPDAAPHRMPHMLIAILSASGNDGKFAQAYRRRVTELSGGKR